MGCNLMTDSSIYCSTNSDDEREQKQMFEVDDVLQSAFNLRHGTALKQINLSKNENIKQQMPIKYPLPQALTASKSILRISADKLNNDFLTKIKDHKHETNETHLHSSDDSDNDDSENEDEDIGLDQFF